ncbi:MAG: NADH-quinone oxidoreductase subunit L [Phycisphaeraceae bacterium]|nr:NADH-quinone oxidoreductase subunit L [Phycisphaeraceae bacterium]
MHIELAKWIPWIPAGAAVLCGLCAMKRQLRMASALICILAICATFGITVLISGSFSPNGNDPVKPRTVEVFDWISIWGQQVFSSRISAESYANENPGSKMIARDGTDGEKEFVVRKPIFVADFSYLLDSLTIVMLYVVTGVGALVAIYAAGYMAGDRGYARFFSAVCLFIFSMTTLVMADNLLLLFLGWEGVGLCSYLLIGYYYDKPTAVAAAKKAFVVNRIGDLGFLIGIFTAYIRYDTVVIHEMISTVSATMQNGATDWKDHLIPFMLMLGAFGKSAQLPLYVWLPDAMEGPTPVSALIHAATMVTAGVYLIVRLLPLFEISPYALPTVAVVGAVTALFAATIALCQYDIKRIYAYSTISQLGYMFLGVGFLSTAGGIFHLFTHAFFKALLFLTAGSVMHALAGQLDLRKMSGLRKKLPVTCWLMFAGCLALAGFPFTAGFFSKDMILAATFEKGINEQLILPNVMGVIGLLTALLTAFYAFRLWFRIFTGPEKYEMGAEHHGAEPDHGVRTSSSVQVEHVHDAHEVSWLMNAPLLVLACGALTAGFLGHEWIERMVVASTAEPARPPMMDEGVQLHGLMMVVSGVISVVGVMAAAYFHWLNRDATERFADRFVATVRVLTNKYYVDELYDAMIVRPLRVVGGIFYQVDRLVIDSLVMALGFLPRALGLAIQPSQRGALQGYGIGMAIGLVSIVVLVLMAIASGHNS